MKDLVEEWLSEFAKKGTRDDYRQRINKFLVATKKTIEDLEALAPKEAKHLILLYQAEQKKQGKKNNTILAIICAIRSFYGYLEKPLKFRRGQLLKLQAAKGEHVFSNGDFGKMYNSGNAFDKAILAVGVSLGWEASAITAIDRKEFEAKVKRARSDKKEFYFFDVQREKTGELRFGVLNPLAIEALETYLEVSADKAEEKLFPITEIGMNVLLRRLAREANIVLVGKIRWHLLRKWLMNTLSKAGFNSFMVKLVMGKAISVSDLTYLQTLKDQIIEKYPQAYENYLCILKYQNKSRDEVSELKAKITTLEQANKILTAMLGDYLVEQSKHTPDIKRSRKMNRDGKQLLEMAKKKA